MKSHLKADAGALMQSSGPLHTYIPGFAASLQSQGYCKTYIDYKLRLVRSLDRWMRRRRMGIEDFAEDRIPQFLHYRYKRYIEDKADRPALHSLLKHLRDAKVVSPPISQLETGPLDHLQAGSRNTWRSSEVSHRRQ